jgi:hypothetical protein
VIEFGEKRGVFCGGIDGYVGKGILRRGYVGKGIFVAGLVAMLGEGHFCDMIGGYVGRRAFLWLD